MTPTIWTDTLSGHKQRQREHILQTAAQLIAERGAADMAMSALARRAGIARTTLYHYFPDAERVLVALVSDQAARFRAELDRRLSEATNSDEQLTRYLVAVHGWATRRERARGRHADGGRKLSPHLLAVVHEPLADLRDLLANIVAGGVADGTFAGDIDPRLHADLILKLVTDPAVATERARDQLVRFVRHGLAAHVVDV
jgi:AcrR family transcriptional regulator